MACRVESVGEQDDRAPRLRIGGLEQIRCALGGVIDRGVAPGDDRADSRERSGFLRGEWLDHTNGRVERQDRDLVDRAERSHHRADGRFGVGEGLSGHAAARVNHQRECDRRDHRREGHVRLRRDSPLADLKILWP